MSENAQWYLLQTKARDEYRALENLHNQGVHTYCPTIEVNKIVRGKRQRVTEVLFPGYIFVQLDEQSPSFTSVRSTRGVSKFVSFGSSPAVVPEALIQLVQQQCDLDTPKVDKNAPQTGDTIEITEGAFKGLKAVFSQPDGAMRAIVLVTVMSQQVPVSIDNRDITKVDC
jgi:transcriptional antiterminator RfaH